MIRLTSSVEIAPHVSRESDPIQYVMERIDRSPYLFQVIVSSDGVLIGTVTDGDIRRAMLKGIELDRPARDCMNVDPDYGFLSDDVGNRKRLAQLRSSRRFLPVVDTRHRLVEILVDGRSDVPISGIKQALVMAGGFGRRLGERTRETPKPLLNVGGRPILEHVLLGLEAAGVPRITLSIHYLGAKIRRFVRDRGFLPDIDFIEEEKPLGTAGAIGLLRERLEAPLLIVNGDVLTNCDFAALHDFHLRHDLDGTIGVTHYEIDLPYGVVRYDEDGYFTGIEEKPRISNFIAGGVYYLGPEFAELVPTGRPFDMPELLSRGREIGLRIGLFPIHEYWADVGHPEDLAEADARHTESTK